MTNDILIIGAGITGVCIAESLRRSGKSVTLVDRIAPGDPAQTSYGNAGLLARGGISPIVDQTMIPHLPKLLLNPNSPVKLHWPYLLRLMPWALSMVRNGMNDRAKHIIPAMNELLYDTVEQHLNLAKDTAAEKYIQFGGTTTLYPTKSDYLAGKFLNKAKKSLGLETIEYDLAALKKRDPDLGDNYTFGVEYKSQGWLTDPAAYVAALACNFTDNGGTFLTREVVDIGGDHITCKGGEIIKAGTLIIAAGAWSKKMAETFGHKVPLQGERGYHILLKNPSHTPSNPGQSHEHFFTKNWFPKCAFSKYCNDKLAKLVRFHHNALFTLVRIGSFGSKLHSCDCPASNPYLVSDTKFAITPMLTGLRCAGTTEFAPLGAEPTKSPISYLEKSLKRVYPNLTWDSKETWMGNRPTLVDSLPMIGRTKSAPNVIYAFGGQHLGLTMGPKVAHIVRDIVLDTPTNINLKPYAVNRFD